VRGRRLGGPGRGGRRVAAEELGVVLVGDMLGRAAADEPRAAPAGAGRAAGQRGGGSDGGVLRGQAHQRRVLMGWGGAARGDQGKGEKGRDTERRLRLWIWGLW
jgi:hypothetical protein